jgi:hypothetical protein
MMRYSIVFMPPAKQIASRRRSLAWDGNASHQRSLISPLKRMDCTSGDYESRGQYDVIGKIEFRGEAEINREIVVQPALFD